jgi:uncharacterized SAM-binding protein YcdF (DUF218 family)
MTGARRRGRRPPAAIKAQHGSMNEVSSTTLAAGHRPGGRTGGDSRSGWIVHALVLIACLALAGAGVFWGGFLSYVQTVRSMVTAGGTAEPAEADGIVVLTGGAERIAGAMALLADGHARRLLISGVHPDTSAAQIGRMVDAGPSLFDCCVDLDRRAANTSGNALEAAKWARDNAFGSLIVVTSAYHMPRSLAEFGAAMPQVALTPWPVVTPAADPDRWWRDAGTAALLLGEYLKYMAARARLGLAEAGRGAPVLAEFDR